MQFEIPFNKSLFSKEILFECINEWEEHLPAAKYSKDSTNYLIETGECDETTCNEFINYVIDKHSMKELG